MTLTLLDSSSTSGVPSSTRTGRAEEEVGPESSKPGQNSNHKPWGLRSPETWLVRAERCYKGKIHVEFPRPPLKRGRKRSQQFFSVAWCPGGLRIRRHHCCGSGHCCCIVSTPGPRISACCRHGQKTKQSKCFCLDCMLE